MRDKEHVLLGVFVGFVFESFAFGDEFVEAFFECGRNVTKEDEPGENFAVVCRRDVSPELAGGELIISGQLLTEKDYILKWFEEAGFKVKVERESGEWWSVLACS
jgi:hypothetical protein